IFLLAVGLGILLGYVVGLAAKRSKVRSSTVCGIVGGLAGLVALYAAWVAWIHGISKFEALVLSPAGIVRVMLAIAEEGAWEISDFTPKGAVLLAVWGVEAAILVGASAYVAWAHLAETPFCERCQAWVDDSKGIGPFEPVAGREDFRSRLEREDYAVLAGLRRAEDDANAYASVELRRCAECREVTYLTVRNVEVKIEKKGEKEDRKERITEVVKNLIVPSNVEARLAEAGDAANPARGRAGHRRIVGSFERALERITLSGYARRSERVPP
ncbi:MAG: hypothetical protein ACYSU0_23565, partial [Planctomycetota bacterium]